MFPGCSSAPRILRDSCFVGFILACLYDGTSGHTVLRMEDSDLFHAATLREEDEVSLLQEDVLNEAAAPLEEDDASLLQVALNRENQSDEVQMKAGSAHDHVSKVQHGQRQSPKSHAHDEADSLLMMKEASERYPSLPNRDYIISADVEALMMKAGDRTMAVLILVFFCIAVVVGLCLIAIFSPGDEESQGLSEQRQQQQQEPQQVVKEASPPGTMEPRGSPPRSGKQPFQRPGSPGSTSPTQTQTNTSMALNNSGDVAPGSMQGLPLCPSLLVPDGTRLACVVRAGVRREKQTLSFEVRSVSQRGGTPIFRVEVQEIGEISGGKPGIFLKALDGRETLASLSTEELWKGGQSQPALSMHRSNGVLFGTVGMNAATGGYTVMRGTTNLLTVRGDINSHALQVVASTGRTIASTTSINSSEYQVNVHSRVDAGLVLLALLAAQKLESPA